VGDLKQILSNVDNFSLRVDRHVREMYRISSSGTPLDRKVAGGVGEILLEAFPPSDSAAAGQ
jgi:hypothetical protein